MYWAQHLPFDRALLIGLAVLVVACPCAVGLAAPMATSLGIGRLARHGCLVRDPAALEALARMRLIAFDKTGTLTSGQARVVAIDSDGTSCRRGARARRRAGTPFRAWLGPRRRRGGRGARTRADRHPRRSHRCRGVASAAARTGRPWPPAAPP